MLKKLTVHLKSLLFDAEHATRGIGMYTKLLLEHLEKIETLTVIPPSQKNATDSDVIHYPSFDFFFSTLPLSIKKNVVVTIHDVIPLLYPDKYPSGIRGKINFQKQLLALRTVKAVITDSETSKKDIEKYLHVPSKKITVVPLAANPALKASSPQKVSKYLSDYSVTKPYVLYVGDIGYNKNIPQLIKMLKYLPEEISLVCIGKNFRPHDIPEWQWIETQLAMSDVSNRVIFINSLPVDATEAISALYTGALCYLQPSLYEGFGLPILEAMQCKTPVVSSDTSALLELVGEYALTTKPTAEAFAEKVNIVYNWTKKERVEVIDTAYAWSQTFSWDKTAKETNEVYIKSTYKK